MLPKLPERKKTVLCSNVDSARTLVKQIMNSHGMNTGTYDRAAAIERQLMTIKTQAIAMEKRLYLYKETIEGLGFKRIRKRCVR